MFKFTLTNIFGKLQIAIFFSFEFYVLKCDIALYVQLEFVKSLRRFLKFDKNFI